MGESAALDAADSEVRNLGLTLLLLERLNPTAVLLKMAGLT